jgi:NAD-dependent deacetylase
MKKIVVLSGAGISADSGLKTFRDMGGLWENFKIEEVATPEGWAANPALVLDFYNQRRLQAFDAQPNAGHKALADLEADFEVQIITQNVDNLHEKAGSTNVMHLHGELSKVRSTLNENLIYDVQNKSISIGDTAEDGAQLRPHIVWFGEDVPLIEEAARICETADIFIVVGTSLGVYPAAGLINYVPTNSPRFVIDPGLVHYSFSTKNTEFIQESAKEGLPALLKRLRAAESI